MIMTRKFSNQGLTRGMNSTKLLMSVGKCVRRLTLAIMNKAYIIQFDNNEPWENHWVSNLCVCLSETQAEKLYGELTDWIEKARREMPASYFDSEEYKNGTITDEQMEEYDRKQQDWFDSLIPPYGFQTILGAVSRYGQHSGWIRMAEVELIELFQTNQN